MSPPPVAWPGMEPSPFEFPYVEAAAARAALVEMRDELSSVLTVHGEAVDGISERNAGATMDAFRSSYAWRLYFSSLQLVSIDNAIGDVDQLVTDALVAQQAREADHAAWGLRQAAYDIALANGDPVAGPPGSGFVHAL